MGFEPTRGFPIGSSSLCSVRQNVEFAASPKILWSTSGMWSLMPEGTACPGRAGIQINGWRAESAIV